MRLLLILFVLLVVNLPAAREVWVGHELDDRGRTVAATVLDARTRGGRHFVDYRLPREVDPRQSRFSATVDDDAYRTALRTERLDVRVVPGKPGTNRPDGEVANPLFWIVAITGDAILTIAAVLTGRRFVQRVRARSRGEGDLGHETLHT